MFARLLVGEAHLSSILITDTEGAVLLETLRTLLPWSLSLPDTLPVGEEERAPTAAASNTETVPEVGTRDSSAGAVLTAVSAAWVRGTCSCERS